MSSSSTQRGEPPQPVGPYPRWILLSFCFLCVSLVAGLVYGWPALRQELLLDDDDDKNNTTSLNNQEKTLGAIYTVGAWSTQGGRFVTGLARDCYGTRLVTCGAMLCAAAGALGVALLVDDDHTSNAAVALLGVSLFLIGMGSGVQLCVQPVAGLFPNHAGAVLSTLSGAFQISGLVFLVLSKIPASPRTAYLGFCVCLLGLTAVAAILLPRGKSFVINSQVAAATAITQDVVPHDSSVQPHHACGEPVSVSQENDDDTRTSPNDSVIVEQRLTALDQMNSWEYIGLLVWFSILIVPLQYYIGTIGFQLEKMGDTDGFYTDLFSITYASAAVVAPAGGYLADTCGLGIAQGLATFLNAVAFFVLAWDKLALDAQIVGLVSYGVGRMLTFGMYFSNVGKRFGYGNYGTLAGLGLLTSALVSLLQYPLIAWAANGHGVAVNIACGVTLMSVLPYCAWLCRQERCHDAAPVRSKVH